MLRFLKLLCRRRCVPSQPGPQPIRSVGTFLLEPEMREIAAHQPMIRSHRADIGNNSIENRAQMPVTTLARPRQITQQPLGAEPPRRCDDRCRQVRIREMRQHDRTACRLPGMFTHVTAATMPRFWRARP